ncbi:MAG: VOC family protein [Halopseudomonas sp.]
MQTKIDHLVIAAETLSQGIAYVKQCLGVVIPYGGEHPKMGTHNHLMQLGDDTFLEVIAINPEMTAPETPRWFGLDDPFVRRQIAARPALIGWVVNSSNIDTFLNQANFSFGKSELITRGELSWNFGLPDDGRLLAGGMLPYVMEWHCDTHPANNMADLGCRFEALEIHHPQPCWLRAVLDSVDAAGLVKIVALPAGRAPYLVVHIRTPEGVKQLRSDIGLF